MNLRAVEFVTIVNTTRKEPTAMNVFQGFIDHVADISMKQTFAALATAIISTALETAKNLQAVASVARNSKVQTAIPARKDILAIQIADLVSASRMELWATIVNLSKDSVRARKILAVTFVGNVLQDSSTFQSANVSC